MVSKYRQLHKNTHVVLQVLYSKNSSLVWSSMYSRIQFEIANVNTHKIAFTRMRSVKNIPFHIFRADTISAHTMCNIINCVWCTMLLYDSCIRVGVVPSHTLVFLSLPPTFNLLLYDYDSGDFVISCIWLKKICLVVG